MIAGTLEPIEDALDGLAELSQYLTPAAEEVLSTLRKTASAGTSPDGKKWEPTKEGERPLKDAANQIAARVAGQTIVITLSESGGHASWWHFGVKGAPPRPVIPVDVIGEKLGNAIARGAARPFSERA